MGSARQLAFSKLSSPNQLMQRVGLLVQAMVATGFLAAVRAADAGYKPHGDESGPSDSRGITAAGEGVLDDAFSATESDATSEERAQAT